jgi:hypothetical protein
MARTPPEQPEHPQSPWLPSFFERMTCCAIPTIPSESIMDLVVADDDDDIMLESEKRQPPLQLRARRSRPPLDLPSPTLSPSRRELQRHYPSPAYSCCTTSYAGSVATTASIQSDYEEFDKEDIRSTATTEVVSHRNRVLLATTLASAALRQEEERRQDAEERAYQHLMRSPPKSTSQR